MRLEDLMKLSDGFHNKENKIILKQGNIIKILDEDNHSLFAKIMNPKIKTANKEENLDLVLVSDNSCLYSDDSLKKLALNEKEGDLQQRVQSILLKLSEEKKPNLDTSSILKLSQMIKNDFDDNGLLTLRFAQWGGMGNMPDSAKGRGETVFGLEKGDINQWGRYPANVTFDTMLDTVRGPKDSWFKSTEESLHERPEERLGHKDKERSEDNYNLTWSERIKKKNLHRLQRLLESQANERKKEKENSPEFIRMNEEKSAIHYDNLENRMQSKRQTDPSEFAMNYTRQHERLPDWYANLSTLRQHSKKDELNSKLRKIARHSPMIDTEAPSRRNLSPSDPDLSPYSRFDENEWRRPPTPGEAASASLPKGWFDHLFDSESKGNETGASHEELSYKTEDSPSVNVFDGPHSLRMNQEDPDNENNQSGIGSKYVPEMLEGVSLKDIPLGKAMEMLHSFDDDKRKIRDETIDINDEESEIPGFAEHSHSRF